MYIKKPLKNRCKNMCRILIFFKSKNIYIFEHFSDVFFNLFKILPLTLTIKDRGLFFYLAGLEKLY